MVIQYKRDIKDILNGFFIISVFLIFILFQNSVSLIQICMIWALIITLPFLTVYFLSKKLTTIQIDESEKRIILIFKYLFTHETKQVYLLNELRYGYKEKIGARMTRHNELEIFYNDKKIINIGHSYGGWKDHVIEDITTKLQTHGVQSVI